MSYGTLTRNQGLMKPDQDDFYDVGVSNDNMDLIDATLPCYGQTEPLSNSYVWHRIMRSRLINNTGPQTVTLSLSDENGDGYYLATEESQQKISSIVDSTGNDVLIKV